ncbi:MAG: molybdopterin cofactor-binding domain-containing protein [Variovorax sp.]
MTPEITNQGEFDRRAFLKTSGALMVGVSAGGALTATGGALAETAPAAQLAAWASPSPAALESWLAIAPNGAVTVFCGKVDHGQGLATALAQVVAEELDAPLDRVTVLMGDTDRTCNQGGASASTGVRAGSNPLRNAAAEARRIIITAGAQKLGVGIEEVDAINGVISLKSDATRRVTYGELVGGRPLEGALEWNKQTGNGMNVTGQAKPKPVSAHKVVGQSPPRKDIAGIMLGTEPYLTNLKVPGMLHGKMVRPPVSGAVPISFDAASIASIRGARVVQKEAFLGVVAETEWDAIKAARALAVKWSDAKPDFPGHDGLFEHLRKAPVVASNGASAFSGKKAFDTAPTLDALKAAARVVEADYECPFQSHARMSPSVAVADVKDGQAVIYTDTQKPHYHRAGIAKLLDLPEDKVRVLFRPGAGSYGRSDADESGFEAAILSREVGRPVRVQWTRAEGIAWDPKAPAAVITLRAGLSAEGDVTAWYFRAKGFSGWDVKWVADAPEQTLAGQQLGYKKWDMHNFDVPSESYQFPVSVGFWETVAPLQQQVSPLRAAHLRAPQEFQTRYAQESFIDEVCAATGKDPVAFRLKHIKDPREAAVLKAVAERAGWAPADWQPRRDAGPVQRGRGVVMLASYGSYVAAVVELAVTRATGQVAVEKVTVANDSGLVINPGNLRLVIEANVLQGLSRALHEEVTFDRNMVTSMDWNGYPILDVTEAPQAVDIVQVGDPNQPSGGAGEPGLMCMTPAVANAIFNATGVRVRRYPFTAERLKPLLA